MSQPAPQFTPRRQLGRTGFVATPIGIGDLADRSVPLDQCVATARLAIDRGLNLIDTAPSYEDGYSEQIVGQAVQGCRDRMFVIDKIDFHDQPVAPQIDASLRRLHLDHTDLFVFHGLSTLAGWDRLLSPGGGMDQLQTCLDSGKTRFKGISSHHPDVLRQAILSGRCDVVLFPIGPFVDIRYVTDILPLAKSHGVGTVCFKTFAAGKLLGDTSGYGQPLKIRPRGKLSSGGGVTPESDGGVEGGVEAIKTGVDGGGDAKKTGVAGGDEQGKSPPLTVRECVHYTLTCDPDVALLGMSFPNEIQAALSAAQDFPKPLSPKEMATLRQRAAAAIIGKGPCWWNPDP